MMADGHWDALPEDLAGNPASRLWGKPFTQRHRTLEFTGKPRREVLLDPGRHGLLHATGAWPGQRPHVAKESGEEGRSLLPLSWHDILTDGKGKIFTGPVSVLLEQVVDGGSAAERQYFDHRHAYQVSQHEISS